ncbi:MAG: ABA4-like family protein, partial [Verrucomicrobiota bacterium]
FGNRELNRLFWAATLSTAPVWSLMLLFPRSKVARFLCREWIAPPAMGVVYVYLFYLAQNITGLPRIDDVEMTSVRKFWSHPILFIALWMHRMTLDLFVGISMYRLGRYRKREVRLELALTWLLGPVGMMVFAIRYWIAESLRSLKN